MKVWKINPFGYGCNQYLVTADGKNALLFDPSEQEAEKEAKRLGLIPCAVFLTHCHFDHVGGVAALQKTGAKVYMSSSELKLTDTFAELFLLAGVEKTPYTVDETFEDGAEYFLYGLNILCLRTPGHTAGSATYLVTDEKTKERALFTGDTLFAGSVGRTDFPTGDWGALKESLQRLKELDGDYPVYAGHGEDTTLERERNCNPFLK